jgi:hypothetical protein
LEVFFINCPLISDEKSDQCTAIGLPPGLIIGGITNFIEVLVYLIQPAIVVIVKVKNFAVFGHRRE